MLIIFLHLPQRAGQTQLAERLEEEAVRRAALDNLHELVKVLEGTVQRGQEQHQQGLTEVQALVAALQEVSPPVCSARVLALHFNGFVHLRFELVSC